MPADRISKLLEDIRLLDQARFELVQSLREIILGLAPSISEEVKYGGILFSAGQPFCGVFAYARHVSLEFGAGASLPDKYKVLEGEGKLRRHIRLSLARDISGKHVREYLLWRWSVLQAVRPNPSFHWNLLKKPRKFDELKR